MERLLHPGTADFPARVGLRRRHAEEEPPVAKAIPVTQRDVTTQLQIFLDQQLFGPGKIDGAPGEFVGKALKRYQRGVELVKAAHVRLKAAEQQVKVLEGEVLKSLSAAHAPEPGDD